MPDTFIYKIEKIILSNLENEQFGVSELAGEMGLSRSQILRKIKSSTGKSANQYIREIRLKEATALIQNTDLTASEIAYKTGFSSPSYFNKCFLDQFGLTPGDYKKKVEDGATSNLIVASSNKKLQKQKARFIVFFFLIIIVAAIYSAIGRKDKQTTNLTSIAVLPLLDFSESHDKDYLADGITEAITLELARNESIRVISRGSAMKYKNEKKLYSEIADELGVDLLLEGSVLSGNDTLRVVVQLIKPKPEERHIWQNSYDRNHSDVLGLIHNVSSEIASEISNVVEPANENQDSRPIDPEVYDLYLRGRHLCNTQNINEDALLKAVTFLEQALKKDPSFAPAYVTLAETYIAINTLIGDNEEKMRYRENATVAIDKALKLDRSLAEAYVTKGNLAGKLNWDWEITKTMAEMALKLEPSNTAAHLSLSNYYVVKGEYSKAISEAQKAEELDPINPQVTCLVAERYYIAGDFDRSIEKYLEVIDLNPGYGWAYNNIGFVYLQTGNTEKAVNAWQKLQIIRGHQELYDCYNEHPYEYCFQFFIENAKNNHPQFCSNPMMISSVQMLVDDQQGALDFLAIALRYKNEDLPIMITYPDFYPLHENPQFQEIIQKAGIVIPNL